jgi:lysophospholipid acyltransferase (LPLAT)-like uncharacterized protein
VVALGYALDSFWQLKSWDRARVPKPFSTITYKASEPIWLNSLTKEDANKKVKNALMECMS